jgi:Xaa-Pro dipeptidase
MVLTHSISNKDLRQKFLAQQHASLTKQGGAVFVEGQKTNTRTPTADTDSVFRQESNFFYLTGCLEADCAVLINLETNESVLFVPRYGDEYAMWCGDYPEKQDFQNKLEFETVEYNEPELISSVLKRWGTKLVFTLPHQRNILQSTADVTVDDSQALYLALKDSRLTKTEKEVEQLRKIGKIASAAHCELMKNVRPGINEAELEATFTYHSMKHGVKHLAYPSIVAGDNRGATLHYVNNDQVCHDGSLVLIDAGAELQTLYASDITRTFPVNGVFSEDQKLIYEIVLEANKQILEQMKPGVQWSDMHRLAERIVVDGLWKAGFLKADNLQELLDAKVGALFFPHGVGHCLGLDVHDPPNRDGSFTAIDEPGIRYLRCNFPLEKGHVLTVEPGIYFNARFINKALADEKQKQYLVTEKVNKFLNFGGIRIEDNVVVTETGVEVFSTGVPKEVNEIEQLIQQARKQ